MPQSQIGIIGLATMGANLARNFANKGVKTVVYNRTYERTQEFLTQNHKTNLTGTKTLKEFVKALTPPRTIILMVKAGDPVDAVLKQLTPLLKKGDSILELGNSFYKDTERRAAELHKKNLHFWGCGISGGEEGALHGPSLMPGGSKKEWSKIAPLLKKVAAKDFHGTPCVSYIGPGGAGHFVKMVHNGIEYAMMQAIAEAYELLTKGIGVSPAQAATIFKIFNKEKLGGFLLELTAKILDKKDDMVKNKVDTTHLVEKILDKAGSKGTGIWTAVTAMEYGVPVPTIAQAVTSRAISSQKEQREQLAALYGGKASKAKSSATIKDAETFISQLEEALYVAALCAFAQGFDLIRAVSREKKWNISLTEVVRIWQGGCIIRMKLLKDIETEFRRTNTTSSPHLFQLPTVARHLKKSVPALGNLLQTAITLRIPCPALSSAHDYFLSSTQARGNAHIIQGLRDAFGAHTYERTDRDGTFHTQW